MAWSGYFEYGGVEIVNVQRTETYAKHAGLGWFRPIFKNDALGYMLGDGLTYRSPLLDDAPWTDPDIPESYDFYGFYPLGVDGIENSSRTSSIVESLTDGGTPGRIRNAMKAIVFNGLLIAGNDAAADYGMRWLKQALNGSACGPSVSAQCNGADLCYLSAEPDMELPEAFAQFGIMAELDGGYYIGTPGGDEEDGGIPSGDATGELDGGDPQGDGVDDGEVPIDGGTVFGSDDGSGSLSMIQVDDPDLDAGGTDSFPKALFDGGTPTVTGGLLTESVYPFDLGIHSVAYENPTECLTPYLRSFTKVLFNTGPTLTAKQATKDKGAVWTVTFTAAVGNPWELSAEVPIIQGFLDPAVPVPWAMGEEPEGGFIDTDGFLHTEESCAEPRFDPIVDPLFPALVAPPSPPSIPLGNFSPPTSWQRRQFTIPKQFVPLWGEVVPKMAVHARTADLRNLRLRFYADPYVIGDTSDDPCAYCGDIIISYVPQDHSLIFDGAERTVYVLGPGGSRQRADSLVFKSDGTPFEWPALSCGFGYVVTLDLPQTQEPPVVDLSLFARAV